MKNAHSTFVPRRKFIKGLLSSGILLSAATSFSCRNRNSDVKMGRRFHLCLSPLAIAEYPGILEIVKKAGVTDIWLAAFLYGRWHKTPAEIKIIAQQLESKGLAAHIINVPLGHPGNALGVSEEVASSTPPPHWQNACTVDGTLYSGTSIHPPAVEENVKAVQELAAQGFDTIFLDDDFRIAKYPGQIGGCFCNTCRAEFLNKYGYNSADWDMLIDSVEKRNPAPVLRSWVENGCDKLFGMFSAMQSAAPNVPLGNMIMYLGSEKAGLPLDKFRDVPFRVGELMFNDKSFNPIKGKTDELFSALFHRRFAQPELAYSESTAFPADQLSAVNMAAKLTVSLISDVRNTMFMSGLTPFPISHWDTLGPAMSKSARLHSRLMGHTPRGPFKHFWGMDSRIVGRDKPFSLFLASGVPFEVTDEIAAEGWFFLSDEDARAVQEKRLTAVKQNLVVRKSAKAAGDFFIKIEEDIKEMFALKKKITPSLKGIPYVDGEIPAVFAWYPTAQAGLVWNVSEQQQSFHIVRDGKVLQSLTVNGLDVEVVNVL